MTRIGSLEAMTRIGFAARGVMYVMIGVVALRTGRAASNTEALEILKSGAGETLIAIMAVGFLAYGVWRISEALLDTEGHGDDAKGIAVRIGGAISGVIHVGLSWFAGRLAFGDVGGGSSGDGATTGTATALSLPGGQLLLTAVAAAIIGTGLYQAVKALRLGFLKHLDPAVADKDWIKWLGRIGYSARGIVFVTIGWFLWNAALQAQASQAGGTGEAIGSFPENVRIVVAVGFIFFGLFSLVEARYRRINSPDVVGRLKGVQTRYR